MASIEQRLTSAGHDVWVVRYREDGKSRSRSFRSETKAKQWLTKQSLPAFSGRLPFTAKFWMRVDMTVQAPCWIWTGASDGRYGHMHFPPLGRVEKVHRIAWFLAHGAHVPEGMVIDHLCRTTLCVNPSHLDVCTQDENMRRARASV